MFSRGFILFCCGALCNTLFFMVCHSVVPCQPTYLVETPSGPTEHATAPSFLRNQVLIKSSLVIPSTRPARSSASASKGQPRSTIYNIERYESNLTRFYRTLPALQVRTDLGSLAEALGFVSGLEIGVQKGKFSAAILKRWKSCKVYNLVDAWEKQDPTYAESANVADSEHLGHMEQAKSLTRSAANPATKVNFIRGYSNVVHRNFGDESVDFIYVDARHDYCSVREDLELYWPKISCGGIFAGHDYMSADEHELLTSERWDMCPNNHIIHSGAVKAAVDEFAENNGVQLLITYREPSYNSWYFKKQC